MHILTADYIQKYFDEFICSYGDTNDSSMVFYAEFTPETFFVSEKRDGKK